MRADRREDQGRILRPVYETDEDRAREAAFASEIAAFTGAAIHKLDQFSPVDFEALRDGCRVALLEIKCRPELASTTFSTYLIGQRKVETGLSMAQVAGVPYFLFVKWGEDEQRGYWHGVLGGYIVEAGGRRDRADPADVELCCHIPISNFVFF